MMTYASTTRSQCLQDALPVAAGNRERHGVSLVEILISIVILAVLVAIAVPSTTKYAATSRQVNLQQTARDIADGLDAEFLRMKGYPTAAAYYATSHPETPRIKPAGVQWGVFSTTTDARGALVKVEDAADLTDQCTLGIGTLASSGLVCSKVGQ